MLRTPSIHEFEESIGIASDKWHRRCGDVLAYAMKNNLLDGQLKWGYYVGLIHEDSIFCENGLVDKVDHFWLELDDGRVLDPSKWIITCEEPYVHLGDNDGDYVNGIEYNYQAVLGL